MSYTLILSEKPSASLRIATALAEGNVEKITKNGASYYMISRGGKEIIVAPAVGHLFILSEKKPSRVWTYPVFSVEWKETYKNKNNYWARKYFQNLDNLCKKADEFISATDFDIEGSVIAYNILRFIAKVKDSKRMKFSTLTKSDLENAYENASNHLDFNNIEAGLARHTMDFLWGINTSRALTLSLREAGGYKVLSSGRVQGPTLRILKERDEDIRAFKPTPFWQVQMNGLAGKDKITAFHVEDKFWNKSKAEEVLERAKNKKAIVEKTEKREFKQKPPFPFDLTTLQRESYSNFNLSPKQTLDILQSLYGGALISYPRTSSQKLPAKIGYKKIIESLWKQKKYQPLCEALSKKALKPNEGKKTDSAHPSIFPTGAVPKKLNSYEEKIYDIIVKRFLSVFADPAVRESNTVTIDINNEKFMLQGIRTLKANWIEFYRPYVKLKEQILPEIKKGDEVIVESIEMLDKETQPPKRYTPASILKEMESLGLGTKATRSHILQTLYDRGYIKENSIEVTELGKSVIMALEKYCSDIISTNLTKKFEKEMEDIQNGSKKSEDVIKEAENLLEPIFKKFKNNEKKMGEVLLTGFRNAMKQESLIGTCVCGGDLQTKHSRIGKRFVGCSSYPKCTETFSLPQNGAITITKEQCKKCSLYILSIKPNRKRPWKLCVRDGFVVKRAFKSKKKPAGTKTHS